MAKYFYSVACENDDIKEFEHERGKAINYAKAQVRKGRKHVIVSIKNEAGDLINVLKFIGDF